MKFYKILQKLNRHPIWNIMAILYSADCRDRRKNTAIVIRTSVWMDQRTALGFFRLSFKLVENMAHLILPVVRMAACSVCSTFNLHQKSKILHHTASHPLQNDLHHVLWLHMGLNYDEDTNTSTFIIYVTFRAFIECKNKNPPKFLDARTPI